MAYVTVSLHRSRSNKADADFWLRWMFYFYNSTLLARLNLFNTQELQNSKEYLYKFLIINFIYIQRRSRDRRYQ